MAAWARLRVELRDRGLRMPVNDSWIAATAIALGVAVVTQDDGSTVANNSSDENNVVCRTARFDRVQLIARLPS